MVCGPQFLPYGIEKIPLRFYTAVLPHGGPYRRGHLVICRDRILHGSESCNRVITLFGGISINQNDLPTDRARVAELAKDVGLKIRSLAVRGFESPLSHHPRSFFLIILPKLCSAYFRSFMPVRSIDEGPERMKNVCSLPSVRNTGVSLRLQFTRITD